MKQYTMGDVTELAEECISLGKGGKAGAFVAEEQI